MELIKTYFNTITDEQLELLQQYAELLKDWNAKINLISRKNEDAIVEQHILHSLAIFKFIQFKQGATIIDLGTGGGLPGVPLAIVQPQVQFHLVDSIAKKVMVVQDVIDQLALPNCTAEQCRVEKHKAKYDFVVTRAVANTQQLVNWTKHLFKKENNHNIPNGIIALKGGDLTEELAQVNRKSEVTPLSNYFKEHFFETKKIVYVKA